MGNNTAATVETCPTTVEEIVALGRYNLRALADQFGLLADSDSKQSFLKLSTEDQAAAIHAAKVDHDKQKGGGKTTTKAAVTRTPVTSKAAKTPAAGATSTAAADAGNQSAGGNAAIVLEKLNELIASVSGLREEVATCREEVAMAQGTIAGTNRLSMVSVSLALMVSENLLNDAPASVLANAIAQVDDIEPQLREILESQGGDEASGNE